MNKQKQGNVCTYIGCKTRISPGYDLCREHYKNKQDGLITPCPKCGRYKDAQYDLCSPCRYHRTPPSNIRQQNKLPKIEHSPTWDKGDKNRTRWFVYILKLDNGKFYVGHTGELSARLMEHRDGKTITTRGKEQKLQYFEILTTRRAAQNREAELKLINKSNPRQIYLMVSEFENLNRKLDYK